MKPRTYLAQRGLLSRDLLMLQTDVVEEVEDSGGVVVVEAELVAVKQITKEMVARRTMIREHEVVAAAEVPVVTVVDLDMLTANLAATAKMETREILAKTWAETNQMKEGAVEDEVVEVTEAGVEVDFVDVEVVSAAVDVEDLEDAAVSVVDEEEVGVEDAVVVDKVWVKMQERAVLKAKLFGNDAPHA